MTEAVYCVRCAGTGEYPPGGDDECSWCNGDGEYLVEPEPVPGPDTTTCPRCERKGLRAEHIPGSETDPRDPLPSAVHYWCSTCQHYWHPVELLRPRAVFTGDDNASRQGAAGEM